MNEKRTEEQAAGTARRFPSLAAWALAFGCVIGWGSFVMPGTTFLPEAGPAGTVIGAALSAAMILVIGSNYVCLMKRFPEGGGSYTFIRRILGEDHAFLTVWSLALAYLSLLWANATAFILIGRYFIGDALQWGFHYTFAGYDVYLGEVLATILIQSLFGVLTAWGPRAAVVIRTALAVVLFGSVVILFIAVALRGGPRPEIPAFAAEGPESLQILNIVMLAPWMYVGFETITGERGVRHESARKLRLLSGGAILAGMTVYILLALIGASNVPEGFHNWRDYVENLGSLEGFAAMPVFYNVQSALGNGGVCLLGLAILSALSTSVLGFYHATARIIRTMAASGLLPAGLAEETRGVPRRAVYAIMLISLPVPLLGRTAVGWNADVSTLSVSIVYVYISICAFAAASRTGNRAVRLSGLAGMALMSLVFLFLLIPNIFSENALATESYLMLAAWSMGGILYYWFIFYRDRRNRFGKSTVMWIMMLFLLFFSTNVWVRLYHQERIGGIVGAENGEISSLLMTGSLIQLSVIAVSLLIMFSLFSTMLRRERQMESEKMQADVERKKAEESSQAKSAFLSNMSHDIRTPMNAIIGYTDLSLRDGTDAAEMREYLRKIRSSSQHLLALINDVLEMSRIESGKMDLEPVRTDLLKLTDDVRDMFHTQMETKGITYTVDAGQVADRWVLCDKNRLNRVLLNLLSNAYKFTPEGGRVSLTLTQTGGTEETGEYELRVKDSGIGMSPEFAARVFEAFERERTSTVSGIQGTGLGMAITKSIVDLMGGTITVETEQGKGTEFLLRVSFPLAERGTEEEERGTDGAPAGEVDFTGKKVLLTEDNEINREIATLLLEEAGFTLDTAENGQIAVEKVRASKPGDYDAVLMDIQMPVMDGYTAARAIRALEDPALSRIPIIAMTANAFTEDIKAAEEAGMNGHIAKPLDVAQMMRTLAEILR